MLIEPWVRPPLSLAESHNPDEYDYRADMAPTHSWGLQYHPIS